MPGKNDDAKENSGFLGSLRDALTAASREEDGRIIAATDQSVTQTVIASAIAEGGFHMSTPTNNKPTGNEVADKTNAKAAVEPPPLPSAAEAARQARGGTPNIPPVDRDAAAPAEPGPPTTRVVREKQPASDAEPRTKLVRGGQQQVQRGEFNQDPVVGWLVIVGGPGIGAFRPIFEGNNTVGRSSSNRVPIDFGDDAISGEEQIYVRYDSADRSFLLVPNMSKTNVVSVNDKRPTSAIALQAMDVVTMGRTQLVFVPFCGPEFDWGELSNLKT